VWGLCNLHRSLLPFLFSLIIQSGVYHQRFKVQLLQHYLQRKEITAEIKERTYKKEVLDMTSAVQTVFILYSGMIVLAVVEFVIETCLFRIYKRFS